MAVKAHVGHAGLGGVQGHSAGEIFPVVLCIRHSYRDPLYSGESLAERHDGGSIELLVGDKCIGVVEFDAVGECTFAWAHDRAYQLAHQWLAANKYR